jgi:hypothetical protein
MKILQLLKSEPDADTRDLVAALSEGSESEEIRLFVGGVDYEDLVHKVFDCDKVVCWW